MSPSTESGKNYKRNCGFFFMFFIGSTIHQARRIADVQINHLFFNFIFIIFTIYLQKISKNGRDVDESALALKTYRYEK